MLRSIRDNIRGRAAKAILAVIIVPFVFFGVGSLVDDSGVPNVLEINGEEIDQNGLLLEMQNVRGEALARMGQDVDYNQLTEAKLAPVALERLTRKTLLDQLLAKIDMGVPDALVTNIITDVESFQIDGQFSNELLSAYLNNQRKSLTELKRQIASEVAQSQLASGVALSNFSLPFSTEILIDIFNESREVNWVKLPIADISNDLVVSDEEIDAFYQANQADYRSELLVTLEYIELRREALYQPVTEEQLAAEYRLRVDQFESSESRRVAHILLEVNDQQTKDEAMARMQELQAKLAAGEDFTVLAAEYSQDSGSAEDGGELGYAQQDGTYPGAFEEAIFELALNEISAPVETDAGLHLITVTDIDTAVISSLEELRAEMTEGIQVREAQAKYVVLLEQAKDVAFNAADLSEPAELLDLQVQTVTPIGRNGPTTEADLDAATSLLFSDSRLLKAAFSDEVIGDSVNSDVIELAPDRSIVLRVKELFEPRQLALEEVNSLITPIVLKQKASDKLASLESSIKSSVLEGKDFTDAIEQAGYSVSNSKVSRSSTDLDRGLLMSVFEAPRSSIDTVEPYSYVNASGDNYLYKIVSVDVSERVASEQVKEVFAKQIQSVAGQQDWVTFFQSLEAAADIKRF